MAYLHLLSQIPGCPKYTGDRITSCTCLQLLTIDNNNMLRASQFMVDFQGINFNAKKALYIIIIIMLHFFCQTMPIAINGVGNFQCYILPTILCATTNDDLPMKDR